VSLFHAKLLVQHKDFHYKKSAKRNRQTSNLLETLITYSRTTLFPFYKMSRHRDIRNRSYSYDYDDYYDDDDDDDYDDYDDGGYHEEQRAKREEQNSKSLFGSTTKSKASASSTTKSTSTATSSPVINESSIAQLTGMGFAESKAKTALKLHNGDVDLALNALLLDDVPDIPDDIPSPIAKPKPQKQKHTPKKSSASLHKISTPPPGFGGAPKTSIFSPPPGFGGVPKELTPSTSTKKAFTTPTKPPVSNSTKKGSVTKLSNFSIPPPITKNERHLTTKTSKLSLIFCGHVDAGKSTLVGQILLQTKQVTSRQIQKQITAAANMGKASFGLAWVMDEDSERERGVTMEVGTRRFDTEKHQITVLDAPGHADFIPQMIGGASCADVGVLVVDSLAGGFESGMKKNGGNSGGNSNGSSSHKTAIGTSGGGGQTREHLILARALGVTQLIVVINKLDRTHVPWDEERYNEIQRCLTPLIRASGFVMKRVRFVPVSGLTGVNVKDREGKSEVSEAVDVSGLNKWYQGITLLEAIDTFVPAKRDIDNPLRVIVTDAYPEGRYIVIRGRVVQGLLRSSQQLLTLPLGDITTASRLMGASKAKKEGNINNNTIITDSASSYSFAYAGDSVEISLSGLDDMTRIHAGMILCHPYPSLRCPTTRKLQAKILTMEQLVVPLIKGTQCSFLMNSVDVPAYITKLVSIVSKGDDSGHQQQQQTAVSKSNQNDDVPSSQSQKATPRKNKPRILTGGMNAIIQLKTEERICCEPFRDCRALGRFVLRRGGETVAMGVIEQIGFG